MKFDADHSFWLIELLLPTARRLSLRTMKLAKTKLVVNGKITALNKQVCLTRIISHVTKNTNELWKTVSPTSLRKPQINRCNSVSRLSICALLFYVSLLFIPSINALRIYRFVSLYLVAILFGGNNITHPARFTYRSSCFFQATLGAKHLPLWGRYHPDGSE